MSKEALRDAVNAAQVGKAFEVLDFDGFYRELDAAGVYGAVPDGSFVRFLQGIVIPSTFPATWQKLSDLGWSDREVSSLVDNGIIHENPTTLVAAINMGALSLSEYNEFANYPNQEVEIFYLTPATQQVIAWLQGKVTLPRINGTAFASEE